MTYANCVLLKCYKTNRKSSLDATSSSSIITSLPTQISIAAVSNWVSKWDLITSSSMWCICKKRHKLFKELLSNMNRLRNWLKMITIKNRKLFIFQKKLQKSTFKMNIENWILTIKIQSACIKDSGRQPAEEDRKVIENIPNQTWITLKQYWILVILIAILIRKEAH